MAVNHAHSSITIPAQFTYYNIGGEEIKLLRNEAIERLKEIFDIKEFHNKELD